jgi:hypothetical protein
MRRGRSPARIGRSAVSKVTTLHQDLPSKRSSNNSRAFDQEMMVRCPERVECSTKIAMSMLSNVSAAMDLLRNSDLPRRIFLGVAELSAERLTIKIDL